METYWLTATNKVPLRVLIPLEVVAPKQVVTRVYTRRPKVPKSVQNSKPKVAKSMTTNRMELDTSRGSDTSIAPSSSEDYIITYLMRKRELESGTFTSIFKYPALKQLAIKRGDEYGFVIRPCLVGVTFESVRIDL
ncbi:hypothetical protein Tco_1490924 [Tanacetum coccineum]